MGTCSQLMVTLMQMDVKVPPGSLLFPVQAIIWSFLRDPSAFLTEHQHTFFTLWKRTKQQLFLNAALKSLVRSIFAFMLWISRSSEKPKVSKSFDVNVKPTYSALAPWLALLVSQSNTPAHFGGPNSLSRVLTFSTFNERFWKWCMKDAHFPLSCTLVICWTSKFILFLLSVRKNAVKHQWCSACKTLDNQPTECRFPGCYD